MLVVSNDLDPVSSPINKIPYDVLLEIFTHSMPERPLDSTRESITVPMLLCQVCSSWRSVALTLPSLWSHLRYNIDVQKIDDDPGYAVRRKDLNFIKWWKENQRSVLPFLHFTVTEVHQDVHPERYEAGDSFDLILNYLATAQYIEISQFFWTHLRERQIICPNVQSLVVSTADQAQGPCIAQSIYGLLPSHTPSPLRRLSVNCDSLLHGDIVPQIWSPLTHVSLVCGSISLEFWYTFIRAVPNLQWLCFIFNDALIWRESDSPIKVEQCIHSNLATLSILYYDDDDDDIELQDLFINLHLPVLKTLSIGSFALSWYSPRATTDIHAILQCAPNITTLTLGQGFLHLGKWTTECIRPYTSYTRDKSLQPIWTHAPHLEHLRLELPFSDDREKNAASKLSAAVHEVFESDDYFIPDRWLALKDPTCPIRAITFVFNQLDDADKDEWPEFLAVHAKNAPSIKLQFSSMLMGEETASRECSEWSARK